MAVSKKLRWQVLQRDNFTCQYCGESSPEVKLQVDHIKPRSLGGKDLLTNLITSCQPCNSGKRDKSIATPLLQQEVQEMVDEDYSWAAAFSWCQYRRNLIIDNMFKDLMVGWRRYLEPICQDEPKVNMVIDLLEIHTVSEVVVAFADLRAMLPLDDAPYEARYLLRQLRRMDLREAIPSATVELERSGIFRLPGEVLK